MCMRCLRWGALVLLRRRASSRRPFWGPGFLAGLPVLDPGFPGRGCFWLDWGWPALMVVAAGDLQAFIQSRLAADSFRRLGLAAGLALICFLCLTSDAGGRWTNNLTQQYLTPDNPDVKGWLPEKGGVLYSSDMTVFYQTFYKNPHGDWRYMLGFEPALMPAEDFATYHQILWNFGEGKAYAPWLLKMKPADRLVIRGGRGTPPGIPQLDWNYGVSGIWGAVCQGRRTARPRPSQPPPAWRH